MADSFELGPSILDYSGSKSKRRRKKKDELLALPDSETLASRAGRGALSGLAAAGNALDLLGSSARDLLGGENPLDQWLTPFSADNRLTGRDLLRKHGLASGRDTWGNFAGGFAAEVVLDPLTWLSGGATKGGQLAAKAGVDITGDALRVAGKAAKAGADNWIMDAAGKATGLVGKRKALRTTSTADILREAGSEAGALNDAFDVAARTADPSITDDAITALKNEKLSTGGIGFKIPFGPKVELANTSTPYVGKLLEKGADVMDLAGDAVKYGKYSPIRPLIPIFDKAVRGATTKVGQVFGRQADKSARTGEVAARGAMAPALEAFEKSDLFNADKLVKDGMDLPSANKKITGYVNDLLKYTEGIADDLPGELKHLQPHLDTFKKLFAEDLAAKQAIGLPGEELRDFFARHFPRQKHIFDPGLRQAAGRAAAAFPTSGPGQFARDKVLKDLPGGTAVINEISLDPKVSGKAWDHGAIDPLTNLRNKNPLKGEGLKQRLDDAMRHIAANYPEALKPSEEMVKLMGEADAAGKEALLKAHTEGIRGLSDAVKAGFSLDDLADQFDVKALKELAKEALHFDPQHVRSGQPLYELNMPGVATTRLTGSAQHLASGNAVHDLFATGAMDGGEGIPLGEALRRAGMTGDNAGNYQLGKLQQDPRFKDLIAEMEQDLIENSATGNAPDMVGELLKRITVPAEHVKEAERLMKAFSAPGEVNQLVEVADKVQRLFKSGVTSIFPSFHVRNFMSGLFQNWVIDAGDPRYADPIRRFYMPIRDMDELLKGNTLKDAVEIPFIQQMGITDPTQASQVLRREIFKHNAIGQSAVDDAGDMLAPLSAQMPGLRPEAMSFRNPLQSAANVIREGFPKSLRQANPLNVAGVASEADEFAPVAAGRMVGNYTEKINRGSGFLGLLRQGYSPAEAAKKIRSAQVDYCVDEATEVLTKRGWLTLDEVNTEDECLTVNPQSRQAEWNSVEKVNVFQSSGYMHHFLSTRLDAMSTGNHRWLIEGSGELGGHWSVRATNKTHFKTTSELIESENAKILATTNIPVDGPREKVFSDELVELVGWYVTEGHITSNKTGIYISQSRKHNPTHLGKIVALASHYKNAGCTTTEYPARDHGWGPIVTVYFGKGIGNVVREICPDKQMTPEFICSLTTSQLRLLYKTLMDGDGHRRPNGIEHWSQKCPGRLNAFQMICSMLGKRTRRHKSRLGDGVHVAVYSAKHIYSYNLKKTVVPYEGRVWCPTTKNGTWMARRNGFTFWTGNSNLTNTEKTIGRRVAPFYSFSKGAGEFVVGELAKDPAGRLGKVIRASRLAHDPDEMTPDYVAESAAIPLGTSPDGTKRYITGLGLPFEDPLSFGGGGVRGALLEAASRGNPLLKGPVEWATGQSFFQKGPEGGRPLEDMDPTIGRTLANWAGRDRPVTFHGSQAVEAIAGNSPLSRILTTTRQLSDKRKGYGAKATNLLTGVKVSDVSPAVQDSLLREQAQKILKSYPEARTYTQTFVPKDEWAKLAPDERLKVESLTTILNVLSKRAQRRAEQKKALAAQGK